MDEQNKKRKNYFWNLFSDLMREHATQNTVIQVSTTCDLLYTFPNPKQYTKKPIHLPEQQQ